MYGAVLCDQRFCAHRHGSVYIVCQFSAQMSSTAKRKLSGTTGIANLLVLLANPQVISSFAFERFISSKGSIVKGTWQKLAFLYVKMKEITYHNLLIICVHVTLGILK